MPSLPPVNYGIVIDAGSSGSRIQIYSWPSNFDVLADKLPSVGKGNSNWHKKTNPGISSFASHVKDLGEDHLGPLLKHAEKIIPKSRHEDTPIFLLATAGMRLLSENDRRAILEETCRYIKNRTDFYLSDCNNHIQVIDGESEGLFGWIALNYMLGALDIPEKHLHGKDHSTYGFLDMGGASAQIAFAPNATEVEKHMDDLYRIRLRTQAGNNKEFNIFVSTWLGYGSREARRRYVESLTQKSKDQNIVSDPCLPTGLTEKSFSGIPLRGSGNWTECMNSTYPLLLKDMPCNDDPCLFGGVHAPAIDFDVNHFIGVSEYWYTIATGMLATGDKKQEPTGVYDFASFSKQVESFCSLPWSQITSQPDTVDADKLKELCFKSSWILNMLHHGFGVPQSPARTSDESKKKIISAAEEKGLIDHFWSVDKINGIELSWTLGKMLLYASSQVPAIPSTEDLPIGYGANGGEFIAEKSIAATPNLQIEKGIIEIASQGTLSNRRIPGLIMFFFIFLTMGVVLIGKVRRRRLTFSLTTKRYRRRIFGSNATNEFSGQAAQNITAGAQSA
ncbi:nucleoside phosphatase family-domain-containing protein [Dipodascopsis uninucleata]